jgi:hypothetical protein
LSCCIQDSAGPQQAAREQPAYNSPSDRTPFKTALQRTPPNGRRRGCKRHVAMVLYELKVPAAPVQLHFWPL